LTQRQQLFKIKNPGQYASDTSQRTGHGYRVLDAKALKVAPYYGIVKKAGGAPLTGAV
jgi:hypothetical protein